MLDKKFGAPTITNDGVTIAREIEVEDVFENQGAQLVREVATATNDVAGDGTTTATVLAQAIVREGLKNVAAGANPMALKRGIETAVEAVTDNLKSQSKEISGKEDIARVASISSREREIGDNIADAIEKVGKDGVVNVEEGPTLGLASTFTTPSLPTFSIASAMLSPISRSRDEMLSDPPHVPPSEISLDCDLRLSVTASTAFSMPRLSAIGFAPAATFFRPSRTMAWARTVAVV